MLTNILMVFHVLIAVAMVGLILLQQGKGADAGAAFGAGASGTVFGSQGSASFLSRTTAVLAALFFVTSLTLAYLANESAKETGSVVDKLKTEQVQQKTPPPGAEEETSTVIPEAATEQVPAAKPGTEQAPATAPEAKTTEKTDKQAPSLPVSE